MALLKASRRATLTEVARLAGVSMTTASKAINGRDRVAEGTRKNVLRAARELSYAPNLVAKSLASGRSSIIGVLMRNTMVQRFAMPIVIGAQAVLEEREFSAIIVDARGDDSRLSELAVMLRQRNVDGLLVVGDNQAQVPSITDIAKMPCVYVHGPTTNPRDIVHVVDDFIGAATIIDHLSDTGRQHMAHVTGPRHSAAVQQRVAGLTHALDKHRLQLGGQVMYGEWSQRWGREAVPDLLSKNPQLDAIACGSDHIAAGVMDGVVASGRRVPEDVAITGYDNWTIFALDTEPPLTTVDMDLEHLGASAVSELFDLMGGTRVGGGTRYHKGTLIVRGSTGPRSA